MVKERSLTDTCASCIAQHMPYSSHLEGDLVPVELVQLIYTEYIRLARARKMSGSWSPAAHLECMRQFAAYWYPSVFSLNLPQIPGTAFAELTAFSSSLVHLSLTCAATSQLLGLSSLTGLWCLSLRGCTQLQELALHEVLRGLTQLRALDLCGLPAVSDTLAPVLASLQQLQVLNINRTQCSDVTVDWLTYGHRLHQWHATAQEQQQQLITAGHQPIAVLPPPQQQQQILSMKQWPRCTIKQWHLARTRITARTADLLCHLPELTFVDMRGSGVTASQLVQLRVRFHLNAPQGGVLSCSAAMAVAAISLDTFVCAAPANHNRLAAEAGRPGQTSSSSGGEVQQQQHGVVDVIVELVAARAEADADWQHAAALVKPVATMAVPSTCSACRPHPMHMGHSCVDQPYSPPDIMDPHQQQLTDE